MEVSGIVRRIDDLGRVVIPKEMRRKLKIEEGDQVEIILDKEGKVDIKKYLPLGDKYELLQDIADTLSQNLGFKVLISDKEKIIIDTSNNKDVIGENINSEMLEYIKNRESYISKDLKGKKILVERSEIMCIACFPIIVEADSIGMIYILPNLVPKKLELNDINIIKFVLDFLKNYF